MSAEIMLILTSVLFIDSVFIMYFRFFRNALVL